MYELDKIKVQKRMLDLWGVTDQKELAKRAGFTEATVSRLFATGSASMESLSKLCVALKCTPNDILTFYHEEDRNTQASAPARSPQS